MLGKRLNTTQTCLEFVSKALETTNFSFPSAREPHTVEVKTLP